MWPLWLIVSGFFLVAEMITVGFFLFWLGVAGLLTMLLSFFISNLLIQCTFFVLVSGLLIFFTKPFVKKFVKSDTISTNAYSIVGKTGLVIATINPIKNVGQVKIGSEVWSATTLDDTMILEENTKVNVVSINGVKAIVSPVEKKIETAIS